MKKQTATVSKALIQAFLLTCAVGGSWAAVTDGLVSHWPLEAVENGMTPDVVGNNDMNVVGVPAVESGQVGNAFHLGGTVYMSLQHGTDPVETGLPIYGHGSYTIAFWVKGPAQTARYLFTEGSTTSNNPLLILQTGQAAGNNALFDVIIRNDAGGGTGTPVNHRVSTTPVFDDTWHHVAWVDDNGAVTLYIDGVADGTDWNYTPVPPITFNTTAIGTLVRAGVSTGNIFNGLMDEVAVWNRALTGEEVLEWMEGISGEVIAPSLDSDLTDATRRQGEWHRFTLRLSGTRPFDIQWYRNGELIPGASGETYQVTGLMPEDSGDTFHATISNSAGMVTTATATIMVSEDPAPDVQAGLLNYWPLDETEEAEGVVTTPDLYSGNDLVLAGYFDIAEFVDQQNSVSGNSLFFNYVSHYAYRTNGSPIYNNENYSVSFWVKGPLENQSDRRVFSEGSDASNTPLFAIGTDPQGDSPSARIFIRSDANVGAELNSRVSTRAVFDDTWHHVVWTDANGEGKLYIDGVLDETDFSYTRGNLSLNQTSLGAVLRATADFFFFGNMDEVATWNRALTWSEVQEIFESGVPAPAGAIAPFITAEPAAPTDVFQEDDITLTVQAGGTEPLNYQWYLGDQPISGAENPSALTASLQLQNVDSSNSGVYHVSISNTAGEVTSEPVTLTVTPYTPATSGTVLQIDSGLTGSPNVQPGFDEFNLGVNGKRYGGVKVTVSGIDANLAERNRASGAMVANNPPTMTLAQVYNDFVFANSTVDGTGMRILVEHLAPNTPYEVTIWSFDPQSFNPRISDWSEVSSGVPVEIQTGYTFAGGEQPAADMDRTMTAVLTSSAEGTLEIEGRRNGGSGVSVFLNALRLVANPGSAPLEITETAFVDGNLVLTIQLQSEGQEVTFEQTDDLGSGTWVPATGGTIETQGSTVTAEFPASEDHRFYRVVASE